MLFCIQHRSHVDKLALVGAAGMPGYLTLAAKVLVFSGVGKFLMGTLPNVNYRNLLNQNHQKPRSRKSS